MPATDSGLLAPLRRPSGAFAMLAVDQRESLRAMLAETRTEPVTDRQITEFKLAALRALTPFASAVLIDRPFVWDEAVAQQAVAPGCAMIAAADDFIPGTDEIIADSVIDDAVIPARVKADGAKALKLLVIWRPDEAAEKRIALVDDFVARCRTASLASVVEPVSRKPRGDGAWDLNAGILAAARELGNRGADLYKAEVPLHGQGGEAAVRAGCAELNRSIAGAWVVLSSGVPPEQFPTAVEWACREGASGFLAGRAVWRGVLGSTDIEAALRSDAVPRLQRLCEVADRVAGGV